MLHNLNLALSRGGVVFTSGPTWVEVRRSSLHILKDFGFGKNTMEDIIDQDVDNLIQYIEDQWLDTPIDMSQFFNIAVLASLWRIVSGESLKIGDAKLESLLHNLHAIFKELGNPLIRRCLESETMSKILYRLGLSKMPDNQQKIVEFCQDNINATKDKTIDGDNPLTFIEAFVHKIQTTEDKNSPLYQESGELNLVNLLFDLFAAGSDTTATTLNWAMMYMILNPDVQEKVRQELLANIGNRKPSMSDKSSTPYTEAVIHEIQRKGDIVTYSIFHYTSDTMDIGPYKVPKDTIIIPLIGTVYHDPEYFPNPSKFDPMRYLIDEPNGMKKFVPNQRLIPFGIGKRRCLGETLAKMTLYKFFTAIVQRYKIVSGQNEPILDESMFQFVRCPASYKLKFIKI